jgi:hypothetical protein
MRIARVILGFIVAPGLPLFIGALVAHKLDLAPIFVPYAYAMGILGGIPLYVVLRRRMLMRWWHFALGGVALGCVPALLFLPLMASGNLDTFRFMVVVGAPLGLGSALCFWTIAICEFKWRSRVTGHGV